MCFGCSKEPSHWDGSFEYPQHMFWMKNKENSFPIHTLIWRPSTYQSPCNLMHIIVGYTWRVNQGIFILSLLARSILNRKQSLPTASLMYVCCFLNIFFLSDPDVRTVIDLIDCSITTQFSERHWASAWDFQQCGMCDQQSLRSACAQAQSDQSLC